MSLQEEPQRLLQSQELQKGPVQLVIVQLVERHGVSVKFLQFVKHVKRVQLLLRPEEQFVETHCWRQGLEQDSFAQDK